MTANRGRTSAPRLASSSISALRGLKHDWTLPCTSVTSSTCKRKENQRIRNAPVMYTITLAERLPSEKHFKEQSAGDAVGTDEAAPPPPLLSHYEGTVLKKPGSNFLVRRPRERKLLLPFGNLALQPSAPFFPLSLLSGVATEGTECVFAARCSLAFILVLVSSLA